MLGYAFMGRAHAHALITLGHMTGPPPIAPRLVSVAGRDEGERTAFAERFGFERHVADWAEVVADPDVQVLENLLPDHLHAEPVMLPPAPASTWCARSRWRSTPGRRARCSTP